MFGARRSDTIPLVTEARTWDEGVYKAATMGSETTAAATGAVGVLRRDSMAMKPFCGYNFADYFAHWLSFDKDGAKLPKIFHVNWFRKGADGKFVWPGFGDNMRVLEWIIERCKGGVGANETPIGNLPRAEDLNIAGLDLAAADLALLLDVDHAGWTQEYASIGAYLDSFGARAPDALRREHARVSDALANEAPPTAKVAVG